MINKKIEIIILISKTVKVKQGIFFKIREFVNYRFIYRCIIDILKCIKLKCISVRNN